MQWRLAGDPEGEQLVLHQDGNILVLVSHEWQVSAMRTELRARGLATITREQWLQIAHDLSKEEQP